MVFNGSQESIDPTQFLYDKTVNVHSNESLCMSQLYCNQTDTIDSTCDDYVLNKKRLSKGYILSFIFLSIVGLAPKFTVDIEEAMVEETVVDCLTDSSNALGNWIAWLGAQLMYFLLRGRHLILPFFTAQAMTSIFLSETFSVMNVLLNILSITFLIEIDDIFVRFIIPQNQLKEMKQYFNENLLQNRKDKMPIISWLWPRTISIAAVAIMSVATLNIDEILRTLSYIYPWGNTCGDYILALAKIFPYGSMLFMFLHCIKVIIFLSISPYTVILPYLTFQ